MVFGVLYSIWLDRLEDIWTREPICWRVSVGSCWVLLEVIWNGVPLSCWVGDTFVGRPIWYFSFSGSVGNASMVYFVDSWDQVGIYTIDIGVWRELLVAMTNSIWIWCDQWKSIVYVLVIHFEGTSFVCWSSRDRVSISFRALKQRSCVDFARCSLEFGSDLKNLHRSGEL